LPEFAKPRAKVTKGSKSFFHLTSLEFKAFFFFFSFFFCKDICKDFFSTNLDLGTSLNHKKMGFAPWKFKPIRHKIKLNIKVCSMTLKNFIPWSSCELFCKRETETFEKETFFASKMLTFSSVKCSFYL